MIHLSEEKADDHRSTFLKTTFHHLAFTCSAPDQIAAALVQHGIPYRRANVPMTGELQLFFQAPAGNGVELHFSAN